MHGGAGEVIPWASAQVPERLLRQGWEGPRSHRGVVGRGAEEYAEDHREMQGHEHLADRDAHHLYEGLSRVGGAVRYLEDDQGRWGVQGWRERCGDHSGHHAVWSGG